MKKIWLLIICVCLGCTANPPKTTIHISLVNNNQSLKITGIDPVIMHDINRDTINAWQSLFAVYRMPADTAMKDYQPIQPGQYQLKDSILVFTPDTPFTKQQSYFVRYYNYAGNKNIWDYIKGNARIGKLHFTDLIFKR
ncbi:hypothetical protein [Mucilaginibacter sp.]|uniref:hypothetical protein n=1 Tax=Mucilaginibacter sp. TaxID=1882438 RepID=UPI002615DB81|nr:hypothetical protein [Mucilaginibacter sp.]MDB4926670.1 hypothetical protein [Mucilaginibacter sp.]